ncbi:hypothetical protein SAMN06265219_102223 [Gracilimonas mengyeensis]|uniref:Uncharacterized protein n=1 Tax=Gracilimonas mengyeensis TaxID=1302730 RepID=A0A521BED1_9BACT|nr:hypothetical protein SAMN06265219_102223 [Gracilimonas mengyeensis]
MLYGFGFFEIRIIWSDNLQRFGISNWPCGPEDNEHRMQAISSPIAIVTIRYNAERVERAVSNLF